jgi:hypothetical protein
VLRLVGEGTDPSRLVIVANTHLKAAKSMGGEQVRCCGGVPVLSRPCPWLSL